MQLSENFYLKELTKLPRTAIPPTQLYLLKALCEDVLQPVRDFLGCKIKITSGLRTTEDHRRLIAAGYSPSETSDHFFGAMVRLTSHRKIARFGGEYPFSVGAADIIPACGAEAAYWKMRPYFDAETGELNLPAGVVKIGQFLLEKSRTYWVHVSNPATLVYSKDFAKKYLKKTPFMLSLDNGRSYQSII